MLWFQLAVKCPAAAHQGALTTVNSPAERQTDGFSRCFLRVLCPVVSTGEKSHCFGKAILLASRLKNTARIQWEIRLQAAAAWPRRTGGGEQQSVGIPQRRPKERNTDQCSPGEAWGQRRLENKVGVGAAPPSSPRHSFHFHLTLDEGSSAWFEPVVFTFYLSQNVS